MLVCPLFPPRTCTRATPSKLLRQGEGCEGYDTNHDTNRRCQRDRFRVCACRATGASLPRVLSRSKLELPLSGGDISEIELLP